MKWKNKRPGRFSKVLWSSLLYLRIYNNSRIIERSGCARQHTLVFLKAGNRGRLRNHATSKRKHFTAKLIGWNLLIFIINGSFLDLAEFISHLKWTPLHFLIKLFETNVNSCIIVGKKDFHTVVAPIRYSINMKEALENSITFQYFA